MQGALGGRSEGGPAECRRTLNASDVTLGSLAPARSRGVKYMLMFGDPLIGHQLRTAESACKSHTSTAYITPEWPSRCAITALHMAAERLDGGVTAPMADDRGEGRMTSVPHIGDE